MTIYYLYIKTHKITGLKYLGQTSKQNPFAYYGSGVDWKHHLQIYGKDHYTEILLETTDKEKRNYWGRYYSKLWNITHSQDDFGNKIWANRIPETGGGGSPSEFTRNKLRQQQLGRKKPHRTKIHTENQAITIRGRSNPKVSESLKKWYKTNPNLVDTREKQSSSLKRWYKENPDKSKSKSAKTWDSRYRSQKNEYEMTIRLISGGAGVKTIKKKTGMNLSQSSINRLRDESHRIFTLFPEFIKLVRA